jgi:haloalkane dehalogenase
MIAAEDPHPRERLTVLDSHIDYVQTGAGDRTLVFLHGNPTSSYLWRNVIARLSARARCLAPDLIGMGNSGKPRDCAYRFADHARYLQAWFEALDLTDVVLVCHDWGSALGFDWASRHAQRVAGIAYMEAIVRPLTWDEWPAPSRKLFQALRSPDGETMILEKNVFVERILPGSIQRSLSDDEMTRYRAPFDTPDDRLPTLQWPREIPLDGEPNDVHGIVSDYADWLSQASVPKLFVNTEPGAILVGAQREFCRRWPNQTETTVPGIHFPQEDSPLQIADAIGEFLDRL